MPSLRSADRRTRIRIIASDASAAYARTCTSSAPRTRAGGAYGTVARESRSRRPCRHEAVRSACARAPPARAATARNSARRPGWNSESRLTARRMRAKRAASTAPPRAPGCARRARTSWPCSARRAGGDERGRVLEARPSQHRIVTGRRVEPGGDRHLVTELREREHAKRAVVRREAVQRARVPSRLPSSLSNERAPAGSWASTRESSW